MSQIFQKNTKAERKYQSFIRVNAHEKDDCPFTRHGMLPPKKGRLIGEHRQYCGIKTSINCRYGLTEIVVPHDCPLRKASITIQLKQKLREEY